VVDLPVETRRQLIERGKEKLLGKGGLATSERVDASVQTGPTGEFSRKLLETLKVDAAIHLDDLLEKIPDCSPSEMIASLFELEMLGLVKQLPGKNFVKVW
jgi:DNA processing protein